MQKRTDRDWAKTLKIMPIGTLLLSTLIFELSCSPPPALMKIDKSADVLPNGEPGPAEGDPAPGPAPASVPTSGPIANNPMPAPTPLPPAPVSVPEVPKFVPCTEQSEKCHPHQMILADYALGKIIYVNLDDPTKDWDLDVPGGARDIQLIGGNKVMVGTVEKGSGPYGWHEVDIATGKIVKSVTGLTGAFMSAQRLANGNTLLIGDSLLGGSGAVVVETNDKKEVVSKRQFPGSNFRTVRRSRDGHFFIGSGSNMVEYSVDGKEVWRADVGAQPAYMALKLPSGVRVVASGHGGKIFTYDAKTGLKIKTISLPDIDGTHSMPAFASAFAIIPNGNYVTTNWSGGSKTHGHDGPQVSEYTPDGKVVWSWKQQPSRISSIYAVLVLDNLDLSKAHDDTAGPLAPVQLAYP